MLLHISEKFQTDLKTPALIHALINIALENFDKAFEWMEQALVDKDYWLVGLKYLQDWDPIRSDPRFKSVLDRMKFPEKTK